MTWEIKNGKLHRSFKFKDFTQAFAFLTHVAFLAEKHGHHPEIYNVYSRIDMQLCTHDAGNTITEKDYALAEAINRIFDHFFRTVLIENE